LNIPTLWNDGLILPAALFLLLVGLLLIRLIGGRIRKTAETRAEILKVMPAFQQDLQKTQLLHCIYLFYVKEAPYRGISTLPLEYFFGTPSGQALIWKEEKSGLPVLVLDDIRVAGEEAIEHMVLQLRESLPVRYLVRDPARNYPLDQNGLEIQKVQV